MAELTREQKIFWDWRCHVDPDPLTEAERKRYAPAVEAMLRTATAHLILGQI
jgi:hypothetical protein